MNPTKALAHPITLGVFPLPNRVMEVVAVYEDPETAETPDLDSVSQAFGGHIPSLSVTNITLVDASESLNRREIQGRMQFALYLVTFLIITLLYAVITIFICQC